MLITNNSTPMVLAPEGLHTAVCYRYIDMGTQSNPKFGNASRKLMVFWEFPHEIMENGKPLIIKKDYTASIAEKSNLYKDVRAWTGVAPDKEFDPGVLLGRPCNLNIAHSEDGQGQVWANITGIAPLKRGEAVPTQTNPSSHFSLDEFDPTNTEEKAKWDALSEKLREKIALSPEYKTIMKYGCKLEQARLRDIQAKKKENPNAGHPAFEDEIPFN